MPKKKKAKRLKPTSFRLLTPEDAINISMEADPEKVDKRLKREGIERDVKQEISKQRKSELQIVEWRNRYL